MALYGSYLVRTDTYGETHICCREHSQWDCPICAQLDRQRVSICKAIELLGDMEQDLRSAGVPALGGLCIFKDELQEVLEGLREEVVNENC